MKDAKFIELLNLYIDHQISPEESALLEAEVRTNPEHRRIYREYCLMQKGCMELAEAFRAQAPAPAGDATVVAFPARRRSFGGVAFVSSLVATAACVALVITVRTWTAAPAVAPVAAVQPAAVPVKSPAAGFAQASTSRPVMQPVFELTKLTLREPAAEPATAETAAIGEWMNHLQLASLPDPTADDLRLDTRAALQPELRDYRASQPFKGKVEWTAFKFQK